MTRYLQGSNIYCAFIVWHFIFSYLKTIHVWVISHTLFMVLFYFCGVIIKNNEQSHLNDRKFQHNPNDLVIYSFIDVSILEQIIWILLDTISSYGKWIYMLWQFCDIISRCFVWNQISILKYFIKYIKKNKWDVDFIIIYNIHPYCKTCWVLCIRYMLFIKEVDNLDLF